MQKYIVVKGDNIQVQRTSQLVHIHTLPGAMKVNHCCYRMNKATSQKPTNLLDPYLKIFNINNSYYNFTSHS